MDEALPPVAAEYVPGDFVPVAPTVTCRYLVSGGKTIVACTGEGATTSGSRLLQAKLNQDGGQ